MSRMNIHTKLEALNLVLPPVPEALASYMPAKRIGSWVSVSGQLPSINGELMGQGCVPTDVTLEEAQDMARQCVLNGLAALDGVLDHDWSQFDQVGRVGVFVASAEGFDQQHLVANGASDLLQTLFGEAGRHARAAVGVNQLPLNSPVEVELMVHLKA